MRKLAEYNDVELLAIMEATPSKKNEIFNIIYKKYSTEIFSLCVIMVGNKQVAADLCQETWMDFNKSLEKEVKIDNIRNLLITITRRKVSKYFEEQQEKSNITLSDNLDSISTIVFEQEVFKDMHYNDLLSVIELAMTYMKPEMKDPFIMRKFCSYDYEVIARICNCSKDAARQKVARATEYIYKFCQKYIEDLNMK